MILCNFPSPLSTTAFNSMPFACFVEMHCDDKQEETSYKLMAKELWLFCEFWMFLSYDSHGLFGIRCHQCSSATYLLVFLHWCICSGMITNDFIEFSYAIILQQWSVCLLVQVFMCCIFHSNAGMFSSQYPYHYHGAPLPARPGEVPLENQC